MFNVVYDLSDEADKADEAESCPLTPDTYHRGKGNKK